MRKILLAMVLGLIIFVQPVSVSADMVVFWGVRVVDRSTLRVKVWGNESGQIQLNFYWGGPTEKGLGSSVHFLCNEKFQDKYKETIDVVLKTFDKDKYILPLDIFNKAGLTGCKIITLYD